MSKKTTITIIVILTAVAVLGVLGYYVLSTNMWTTDGNVATDGHTEMIEDLKNIEDPQKKEDKVNFFLNSNAITQEEADEILGK